MMILFSWLILKKKSCYAIHRGTGMSHLMQKCKFILGCLQWPGWVGHSASKLNNWKTGVCFFD